MTPKRVASIFCTILPSWNAFHFTLFLISLVTLIINLLWFQSTHFLIFFLLLQLLALLDWSTVDYHKLRFLQYSCLMMHFCPLLLSLNPLVRIQYIPENLWKNMGLHLASFPRHIWPFWLQFTLTHNSRPTKKLPLTPNGSRQWLRN